VVPSEDPSDSSFLGCNAVVDLTIAQEGSLGMLTKTVTNDGAPVNGITVEIYGVDTDSLGNDTCNDAAFLAAQQTGDITSPFAAPGEATFFLQGGLKYCIQVSTVDGTQLGDSEIVFVPVTGLDPADAVVVTNDVTGLIGLINVTAEFDCLDAAGCPAGEVADVDLFLASPFDTSADCGGDWLTDMAVADGDTGTFAVAPGTYCVEVDTDLGATQTTGTGFQEAVITNIVVAAGASVDVTGTITETP